MFVSDFQSICNINIYMLNYVYMFQHNNTTEIRIGRRVS